jgi:predicted ATP-grasp superfamily ATP-dependent carboligase
VTAAHPPAVTLGGQTNALSVARELGLRGVAVHAIGGADSVARHSRHCTCFHLAEPGARQAQYRDLLERVVPRGAVIIPCDDEGLELIARDREELTGWGLRPAHANDAVVLDLLDKERTYEIARAAGVGAPRTITLRGEVDLDAAIDEIGLPCALKPLHIHEFARAFRRKVFLIRDADTLRRAYARTSELGLEMLLTEIVPGPEDRYWSYYTYIDGSGRPLTDFTKRKLRQHPYGFGGATYHVTGWAADVAEAGRRFLAAAGAQGVACVEFKRDIRTDEPRIIECNSRVTAANELVRLAGIELGWISYTQAAGLPVPEGRGFREGVRLWYPLQDVLAYREGRARGELSAASWLRSLAHPQGFPTLSLRDPLPGLVEAAKLPARVQAILHRNGAGGVEASSPHAPF